MEAVTASGHSDFFAAEDSHISKISTFVLRNWGQGDGFAEMVAS